MALETTDMFNMANIYHCIVENNGICSSKHYSACAYFINDFSNCCIVALLRVTYPIYQPRNVNAAAAADQYGPGGMDVG